MSIMPNSEKVGDVRLIEKFHMTRVTKITKSLPSREGIAKSIIKTNTFIQLTKYQALL